MNVIPHSEKAYEAIISAAYMFKLRGSYGSFEKAIVALMKRKPLIVDGFTTSSCEKYFTVALKVVDDALEFEHGYIRSDRVKKTTSGWIDQETITEVCDRMRAYLKDRNPDAPTDFIDRSIGRIFFEYHLA